MQVSTKLRVEMIAGFEGKVKGAVNKNLMKMGGYCRKVARSSIKPIPKRAVKRIRRLGGSKRDIVSSPGSPPFSRMGHLRNNIFYAWDSTLQGVVVGPAKLSRRGVGAPKALEKGGESLVYKGAPIRGYRKVYIRARPYMAPALAETFKRLDKFFKGTLKKNIGNVSLTS